MAVMSHASTYPHVFTVREVAEILRVKRGVIYREIRKGRLVAQRVGKQFRIHSGELDSYLRTPWLAQPNHPASSEGKTTIVGSLSSAENSTKPELAAELARKLRRRL